jgi:hypothetical protein
MAYANKVHLTPPMSLKFILSLKFGQCYILERMLTLHQNVF